MRHLSETVIEKESAAWSRRGRRSVGIYDHRIQLTAQDVRRRKLTHHLGSSPEADVEESVAHVLSGAVVTSCQVLHRALAYGIIQRRPEDHA
jgi:hypothetical protein